MSNKNLKYFMREDAKIDVVVSVEGLESIVDESGKPIPLEIRELSSEEITKINDRYKNRTPAKDTKGGYIVQNSEIVFKTERDNAKAARHIMVEALVYPNLKDTELMKFYNCVDITDMPFKVFPKSSEYGYVSKKVMEVLGLIDSEENEQKEVDEAKN